MFPQIGLPRRKWDELRAGIIVFYGRHLKVGIICQVWSPNTEVEGYMVETIRTALIGTEIPYGSALRQAAA